MGRLGGGGVEADLGIGLSDHQDPVVTTPSHTSHTSFHYSTFCRLIYGSIVGNFHYSGRNWTMLQSVIATIGGSRISEKGGGYWISVMY